MVCEMGMKMFRDNMIMTHNDNNNMHQQIMIRSSFPDL